MVNAIERILKVSEFLREAGRMYIVRNRRLGKVFAYGELQVSKTEISEADIDYEINSYRKQKKEA